MRELREAIEVGRLDEWTRAFTERRGTGRLPEDA